MRGPDGGGRGPGPAGPENENVRRRARFLVSIDADGDEAEEINEIFQLLRTHYGHRNLIVGGVKETKDSWSRRMR